MERSVTMAIGEGLQWLQLAVSALTLLGGAFTLGRLFERLSTVQKAVSDLTSSIFGRHGEEGLFLRRSENQLILESADRVRGEFDNRLSELSRRIGALEGRTLTD